MVVALNIKKYFFPRKESILCLQNKLPKNYFVTLQIMNLFSVLTNKPYSGAYMKWKQIISQMSPD